MEKETEFLYSVDVAGFALVNSDGSMPCMNDWEDVDNFGKKRKHAGGLVGKTEPFDISSVVRENITVSIGLQKRSFNFVYTGANAKAAKIQEIVKDLNTGFNSINKDPFTLKAVEKTIDGKKRIVVESKAGDKPCLVPVGLSGVLPLILGVSGYIITEEVKSVKSDFEKESGKSVDVTSGQGIRCVVKEADKIKGLNLTISMAGVNPNILSMITGCKYNIKEDAFFADVKESTPTFAFFYFVKAFEKGENNETTFNKVKFVAFPSCQASLPSDNAQEGAFATMELQASCSANKKSNLPMMFYKGLEAEDYKFILTGN